MKVLSLNTYAGSLLLGASQIPGVEIIGSYEDSGFGQLIAQTNFPDLDHRPTYKDWPAQDLSDVVVIAHPPCSAFSVQNCSPTARGVNSQAFACTKKVLEYALENGARALCIESVMGALGGAWHEHQRFADQYGYHLYRVLENGCMWGCQWRDRFWVVYVKKDTAPVNFTIRLVPNFKTVSEVIDDWVDGPSAGNQDKLLHEQKQRLIDEAKLTPEEMDFFFNEQDPPHPTKALGTLLYETKYKTPESTSFDKWDIFQKYIGGFTSGTMVYLDPNGWAPVLMGGSFWYYKGRCVSENAFKRIMGFPGEYVFPESPRNTRTQMRMYLSKGVMPPIAQWILEEVFAHLGLLPVRDTSAPHYEITCEPNHIADFRISKEGWKDRFETLPPLRLDDVPPHVKEERRNAPKSNGGGRRMTLRQALMEGRVWVSGKPTECLNPECKAVLPEGTEVREETSMGIIIGEIVCPTCAATSRYSRNIEKAIRVARVRPEGPRAYRGDNVQLSVTDVAITTDGLTERKRRTMLEIATRMGTPTHRELLDESLKHPKLQMLPTTMHWHIRQLIKGGHLKENV